MAITLSKRALLLVAVAAAALVVTAMFLLTTDDDQNPIRVKNKQLFIETESKDHWDKPGASEKWHLKGGSHHDADQYTVAAFGANPDGDNACLKPLLGEAAEIQFQVTNGPLVVFTFNLEQVGNKNEPAVTVSGATMSADNSKKVKRLRINAGPNALEGAITQLVVRKAGNPDATCTFPADRKVLVELCVHSCS